NGSLTVLEVDTPQELLRHVGETIGPGKWVDIPQSRIDAFASATDDRQWIHLDAERTRAELGHAPVAHGYLTLSMLAVMMYDLVHIETVGRIVNYGMNKVRFIAPVLAGDKLRAEVTIGRVTCEDSFVRAIFDVSIFVERLEKPVMIAQSIILYFNQDGSGQ
ncbi:MAG: MaoC family dehydratase, partial [Pseudomonadota bacterium]